MRCSRCGAEIPEGEILQKMRVVTNRPLPRGVCDCQVTNIGRRLRVCNWFPGAVRALTNPHIYS